MNVGQAQSTSKGRSQSTSKGFYTIDHECTQAYHIKQDFNIYKHNRQKYKSEALTNRESHFCYRSRYLQLKNKIKSIL